jgi:hypothetical protein
MRLTILALVVCTGASAQTQVCSGDASLDALSGYYASTSVIASAAKFKSWPEILGSTDAQIAGLIVKDRNVMRALAWHEGDTGGHCLDIVGGMVTLRAKDEPKSSQTYRRIAMIGENESWAYLSLFAAGCYSASNGTRWCISKSGITVDSKPLDATFSLDTMEQPDYGTNLLVDGGPFPLLVLAPTPNGYRVFRDTWASDEKRKPIDPTHDTPWLTLTRLK